MLSLSLLSPQLDFDLTDDFAPLLNLPGLPSLAHLGAGAGQPGGRHLDKRQLQVEVSNWINEFDQKNSVDSVTRAKVEQLLFESSYKFIVNKNLSVRSKTFEIIRDLNADPAYHQYLLMCKVYISLCQINKSVEVDYYKVRCNNEYRIIIPHNFSKATSDYLDVLTSQYTFSERGGDGFIRFGELKVFDVREAQPEIHLYKVRLDSSTASSSMVKYIEVSNALRAVDGEGGGGDGAAGGDERRGDERYLIFIADNALLVELCDGGLMTIRINRIQVEVDTVYLNDAISFVPCFKYVDSEDVILFTSRNLHYLVDKGGQFNDNYYGMKHELIECITSEQVDLGGSGWIWVDLGGSGWIWLSLPYYAPPYYGPTYYGPTYYGPANDDSPLLRPGLRRSQRRARIQGLQAFRTPNRV